MRKCLVSMALAVVACCLAAAQATPEKKTMTQVLDSSVKIIESEFVPAAEAMPEDKFEFAPSNGEFKGVRTFAQQVKHVSAVNYMVGASILGEKPPVELGGESGPENIKSKADVVKFAKDSFAYAHKAIASINEGNAMGEVNNPFGKDKVTRLGLSSVFAWHGFDHYGQIVEYLRMNGIVPPASRRQ
jgi:hypothetical protein